MRAPALWLALGFGLGIVVETLVPFPALGVGAFFLFMLPVLWASRGRHPFLILLILTLSSLGFLYARLDSKRPPHAVEQWSGSQMSLEGIVRTEPEIKTHGKKRTVSFVLSSQNLIKGVKPYCHSDHPKGCEESKTERSFGPVGRRMTENEQHRREFFDTQGNVQVFLFQPGVIPSPGDRVRIWGKLEQARPILNPGGFDYGKYLAQNKIYALFNGYGARSLRVLENQASGWQRLLFDFRRRLAKKINQVYEGDTAELFKALILGWRKNISSPLREDFLKTGTTHLLAISGLNITLVAGNVYLLMIFVRASQKAAAGIALVTALGYVILADSGIPVERAGWMAAAIFVALLFEREQHFLNSFFFAFFMLLCFKPKSLFQVSFQLSFLSVFSLVFLVPSFFRRHQWKEALGHSLAVMAGTFPLVIYYFYIFSPVSILANFLAVPLFNMALLTGFLSLGLSYIPVVGAGLIKISTWLLEAGVVWIHYWAGAKEGFIYLVPPSLKHLLIYYVLLALLYLLKFSKRTFPYFVRPLVASLWLVSAGAFFLPQTAPDFNFVLLAAGKNDIAHLQWGRKMHWLINTGRGKPSDQAQWILTPYLRHEGINHLSGILLTDFYARHTGGLGNVSSNFTFDYLVYPAVQPLELKAIPSKMPRRVRKIPFYGTGNIRMKAKSDIRILALVKGQMILGIRHGSWEFLYLPFLGEETFTALKSQRDFLEGVDVVILSSSFKIQSAASGGPLYEELFGLVHPKWVVSPVSHALLKDYLNRQGIGYFALPELGAIQFTVEEGRGMRSFLGRFLRPLGHPDGRFYVRSYLKGLVAEGPFV